MEQKLNGKVALVTGSSRGIGRVIAKDLSLQGASVVVNYNTNRQKAEELVAEIKRFGGKAVAIKGNVAIVSEVERLIQQTVEAYGRLDILINNAGIGIMKPIERITEDDFDKIFGINVKGTFFATQYALKYMKEGGRIINFSTSVVGQMFPTYSIYAGTKGAVEQFTRQLAKELGPRKININCLAPGPVNTEFFTEGKTEEQIQNLGKAAAFGRLGEPDDVSGVILFLVSDAAKWITGQTIRVNGGFI